MQDTNLGRNDEANLLANTRMVILGGDLFGGGGGGGGVCVCVCVVVVCGETATAGGAEMAQTRTH